MRAHSMLIESGDVSFYSQSTSVVAQRASGRAAKTQMMKGKMMPSPRPCKPRSNEVMFMVFLVS
jgi:hypothetical protein